MMNVSNLKTSKIQIADPASALPADTYTDTIKYLQRTFRNSFAVTNAPREMPISCVMRRVAESKRVVYEKELPKTSMVLKSTVVERTDYVKVSLQAANTFQQTKQIQDPYSRCELVDYCEYLRANGIKQSETLSGLLSVHHKVVELLQNELNVQRNLENPFIEALENALDFEYHCQQLVLNNVNNFEQVAGKQKLLQSRLQIILIEPEADAKKFLEAKREILSAARLEQKQLQQSDAQLEAEAAEQMLQELHEFSLRVVKCPSFAELQRMMTVE